MNHTDIPTLKISYTKSLQVTKLAELCRSFKITAHRTHSPNINTKIHVKLYVNYQLDELIIIYS